MTTVSPAQLPPHLRARYGVRRTPVALIVVVALLVAGFVVAVGWATYAMGSSPVQYKLLAWDDLAPDRVAITFEVRRSEEQDAWCVLRAQDDRRIDVGYAVVEIPRGTTYAQSTYDLRTLAPAYVVEVLGCDTGGPPQRVPPPQFPPGVVPPEQPWTDTLSAPSPTASPSIP